MSESLPGIHRRRFSAPPSHSGPDHSRELQNPMHNVAATGGAVAEQRKKLKDEEKKLKNRNRMRKSNYKKFCQKQIEFAGGLVEPTKVIVWWGGIRDGHWRHAMQQCGVSRINRIGKGKAKGPLVRASVVIFSDDESYEIVEEERIRRETYVFAKMGGHETAEYFPAVQVTRVIETQIRIKWAGCSEEQWISAANVKEVPKERKRKYLSKGEIPQQTEEEIRDLTYNFKKLHPYFKTDDDIDLISYCLEAITECENKTKKGKRKTCKEPGCKNLSHGSTRAQFCCRHGNVKMCSYCNDNVAKRKGSLCERCYTKYQDAWM